MGGVIPSNGCEVSLFHQRKLSIKSQFYNENSSILSSQVAHREHPHLILFRMILGCSNGQFKLIDYLMKNTVIIDYLNDDTSSDSSSFTFILDHFLSKFKIVDNISLFPESVDIPFDSNFYFYFPLFTLLSAISIFQNYLTTSEHSEWLKYQHMMVETRYSNQQALNTRGSYKSSSYQHSISDALHNSNYEKYLGHAHWILALAAITEDTPFPISILDGSFTDSSILFANSAFVTMIDYSREEIAAHSFDYYLTSTNEENTDKNISITRSSLYDSIKSHSVMKVGTLYYPNRLNPFLNLQSYIPLYDTEGQCFYVVVVHCDFWKHHQNSEFLQKVDILTEILSTTIIPQREYERTLLKDYFYSKSD